MKKLEKATRKFLGERGWDSLRPSDLAKSISIEAAELLEIFQWTNLSLDETKKNTEKLELLKKELADVFLYALYMSILLNLDTEQIILDKLKYASIKYPPSLVKKNSNEPGTEKTYLQIKQKYRRKGL